MPDRTLFEIQPSRPDWSRLTSILYAMMCLVLLGTFCAPAAAAGGQDHGLASLVKDLNPATAPSTPDDFVIVGGTLFFTAADPQHGRELWRSDGTEGGTALLADINAGADSSGITHMTIFNNTLYFAAYDHQRRPQLWRSDGTPAGTILVFDFASPPYIGYISDLVVASNKLFIQTYLEGIASNHTFLAAARLWRSDGTTAGTSLVFDFMGVPNFLRATNLTSAGNNLFLRIATSANQILYKTDGTTRGTIPLKQFAASTELYGNLDQFTAVNSTLFFRANEIELWKSNGTAAGTLLVKAMPRSAGQSARPSLGPPPNPIDPGPRNLTNINGRLFFTSFYSGLWVSDGTVAGTKLLASEPIYSLEIVDVNGTAFFYTYPSLWRSDGTAASTLRVANLPGNAVNLFNANGTLFFRIIADSSQRNFQLWRSNGTATGTIALKSFSSPFIRPRALNQYLSNTSPVFAFANGRVFFAADDGVHGMEPWATDGTIAGTVLVKNLAANYDSNPYGFIAGNGAVFFGANGDAGGVELWRSDGTAAGIAQLRDIDTTPAGVRIEQQLDVDGTLFFTADTGHGQAELWRSDGTAAGTLLIKLFDFGPYPSSPWPLRLLDAINGTLLFTVSAASVTFWRSDGTPAGTTPLPGFSYNQDTHPVPVNGQFFFAGCGLWRSDGSTAGTIKITDTCLRQLLAFKGQLFFTQEDGGATRLWRSDGTANGTVQLTTIASGPIATMGDKLFYFTSTSSGTHTLWASDGSASGTTAVTNIPSAPGSAILDLTSAGSRLFFRLQQQNGATQLWMSDGSPNGTIALAALPADRQYGQFTGLNGRLVFSAWPELWASDGTVNGTRKLKDQLIGPFPALPSINGSVLFAIKTAAGTELWASDGRVAGTHLVGTITKAAFGLYDAIPQSFSLINNTLFFEVDQGLGRSDIWRSDGTASGTHRLEETETPSALYYSQSGLTLSGRRLFFGGKAGELWAIPISDGVDTYATAPATSFAPAHSQGYVPISYANRGSQSATNVTLTVTLPNGLTYAGDDTGVTPTQIGNTLTWHLPDAGFLDTRIMHLLINTPDTPLGTRYPVTIALGSAEPDAAPADNSASTVVQLARQMFVPLMTRACVYSYTCEEPL